MQRRTFLRTLSAAALAGTQSLRSASGENSKRQPVDFPIVDTHQHLWDLEKFQLDWLKGTPDILRRNYLTADYLEATEGLNVEKTVYLEVDVAVDQQRAEADYITALIESGKHPTAAAVISGRCDTPGFANYIRAYKNKSSIKGVRDLLQGSPRGRCLGDQFVKSTQLLGELGLSFDMTIRPTELSDGRKLVKQCPDTLFVIDHCGVADPKAFMTAHRDKAAHDAEEWKREMSHLADEPNTVCKISGIVAHVPEEWDTGDLAPIVNHCLDVFGPDRVMFGSDWPVCLLGAPLARWVGALKEIVGQRSVEEQKKLFHDNAIRHYRLDA
ncbi:MAG: amidohydrolase family protein [Planctomycetaceae bacterium]|nr:amidohydrolase family protein [Planctomycetaceae bacterium]